MEPQLKSNKKKKKPSNNYIFPNFLAMAMKNADMKTQLQSSMLSMTLLLLGMILMGIYTLIYMTQGGFFKVLVLFNIVAGFLFMSSYLVTAYQQYASYVGALEIQKELDPTLTPKMKKSRSNQILFFGGLIIFLGSIITYFSFSVSSWIFALSVLGIICMIVPFFRKPKENKKKPEPVTPASNKIAIVKKNPSFQKLPNENPAIQQEVKRKLSREQLKQRYLQHKYQKDLEAAKLQRELDQEAQGFNTVPDTYEGEKIPNVPFEDEVTLLEQEDQQQQQQDNQNPYVDYTQPTQTQPNRPQPSPRRFKGKDGRIYYG